VIAVPLRRNRDFMLLQAGQLLSNAGTQTSSIAYPLLVLAVTGSATKTGVVSFARILPAALFALPAGLAADHWNRKWLMITADGVRVLAIGSLAAAILLHSAPFWAIVLVAFLTPGLYVPSCPRGNSRRPQALRRVGRRRSSWPARRSGVRSSDLPAPSRSLSTQCRMRSRPFRCL